MHSEDHLETLLVLLVESSLFSGRYEIQLATQFLCRTVPVHVAGADMDCSRKEQRGAGDEKGGQHGAETPMIVCDGAEAARETSSLRMTSRDIFKL